MVEAIFLNRQELLPFLIVLLLLFLFLKLNDIIIKDLLDSIDKFKRPSQYI